jgi:light-regulated signal transduction histidine kinase (bacteriophytochrome)
MPVAQSERHQPHGAILATDQECGARLVRVPFNREDVVGNEANQRILDQPVGRVLDREQLDPCTCALIFSSSSQAALLKRADTSFIVNDTECVLGAHKQHRIPACSFKTREAKTDDGSDWVSDRDKPNRISICRCGARY